MEHSTIELLSIYIGAYVCILTIKMFIRKGVMPQYVPTQTWTGSAGVETQSFIQLNYKNKISLT